MPAEAYTPPRPHEPDYASSSWADEAGPEDQQASRDLAVSQGVFRCGEVAFAGQPNAGKSTLLNRLLGEKLSIVSPKPQTTRDNLRGILTTASAQLIFLDTPGIHRARTPLNRAMVGLAVEALETTDVVVLVVDAPKAVRWAQRHQAPPPGQQVPGQVPGPASEAQALSAADLADLQDEEDTLMDGDAPTLGGGEDGGAKVGGSAVGGPEVDGDTAAGETAEEDAGYQRTPLHPAIHPGDRRVIWEILRHNQKWMIALNKTDLVRPRHLLPVMAALATAPSVGAIVPISAWTADGLGDLVREMVHYLPVGDPAFDADELTDRPLRFLAAELVREQVFLQIREEVPYGVACETEVWEELADLTHIQIVVHVEKPAQRAILIGRQGARMKALASAARLQIERLTGRKVFLEVHVRVEANWPERMEKLREFGYLT